MDLDQLAKIAGIAYAAVATVIIPIVAWAVRLEGQLQHEKSMRSVQSDELKALANQVNFISNDVVKKLSEVAEKIARMEGILQSWGNGERR